MNKTKFLQADGRWGNLVYPKKPCYIKNVGCGEVSIANILIEMEQYANYTPATIQPYCKQFGAPNCDGTYLSGICKMMKHYGLTNVKECKTMPELWKELEKGDRVVIYLMGSRKAGSKKIKWTNGGHFVASVGYKVKNKKHYLYVKDPWTDNKNRNGWITYEENMKNDVVAVYVGKLVGAKTPTDGKLAVDGIGGVATIVATQKFFGTKQDGYIGGQMQKLYKYYPSITSVKFSKKSNGSKTVKALQKWLGITCDGIIGQGTTCAWQKRLRDLGYLAKNEKIDGLFGVKSMKAWQRFLNDNLFNEKNNTTTPTEPTTPTTTTEPTTTPAVQPQKTVDELAQEVLDGKWGSGEERKKRLTEAGYDYNAVQNRVNELVKPTTAQLLVAKAKEYAWAYGTASSKWKYKTGSARSTYKTALKKFMKKTAKVSQSDCGYLMNTIVRAVGLSDSFLALPGKASQAYPKVPNTMILALKGKYIPEDFLQPGDIIRYRKTSGQHTFMYIGDGLIAEAGRKTWFPRIVKDTKKYNKSNVKKSSIQVLRAK